jgi:poly-gamma-glutamate capsule biosynthesis protein CapA/YwtB (metallophosphatase superfamily)
MQLRWAMLIPSLFVSGCNPNKEPHTTQKTIKIGFAGDVMIGRLVNDSIKEKGYRYLWGTVLPRLQSNNINVVNLETTLTHSSKALPKVFNYKSDPGHVQALVEANINIVNLANNHSKDFDNEGLIETIDTLDQASIKHVGAGKNKVQAQTPVIIEKHGIKIGIIGATDNEPTWAANQKTPGINYFTPSAIDNLLNDISELKKQVNLAIISLHWGPNMREQPSSDFIEAAHKMIDAGADIIHGHSAHIFQGIEIYKNKVIMYDTGDFIDDYAIDPILRNNHSFLFVVHANKDSLQKISLIPTLIHNMQVNLAPQENAEWSINRLKQLSAPFGTKIIKNKDDTQAEVII